MFYCGRSRIKCLSGMDGEEGPCVMIIVLK